MRNNEQTVPYYAEINELLASISSPHKTSNPNLFCLRLNPHERDLYMHPFKRGFYFIALLTNAAKTRIESTEKKVSNTQFILAFQPPGLIYSFHRHSETTGYILYFKPACFSFFKPAIEKEFPFFENGYTDLLELSAQKFSALAVPFEDVFATYETSTDPAYKTACLKLLVLLYTLKDIAAFSQYEQRPVTQQQALLKKFTRLVNNHYIEKRTVEEYAQMLSVSANHLSQSVKQASGKNALMHINDRLLSEAKSLITFTGLDMAEIAHRLAFSDPANFGKFFKKHTGMTPLTFREKPGNQNVPV